MAYTLNSAAQEIVSYWKTSGKIPFKGCLILMDDDGNVFMCAQGQVLHKFGGYTEEQLFDMYVSEADKETARILDISLTHSIFLRRINDTCEGSPQDVLSNPEKYLGPNFEQVLDFWKFIDTLSDQEREKMSDHYKALDADVKFSAWAAAAREVVGKAGGFSGRASDAVADVTRESRIFCDATLELIGNVDNKVAYDLIMSHKKP